MGSYQNNTKGKNKMNYEEMIKERDILVAKQKENIDKVQKKITDIVKSYKDDVEVKFWRGEVYNFEVGKWNKKKDFADWDIDFTIDTWYREDGLMVKINFGISGSFGRNDEDKMEKYIFLGNICKNFTEFENSILNSEEFKDYHEIHGKVEKICYDIRMIEEMKEANKKKEKEVKFRQMLKIGTVIDTKPNEKYTESDEGWYARKIWGLKNRKIVWMTDKNLKFEGDYCRTKIDNVIVDLVNDRWKIKEECESLNH